MNIAWIIFTTLAIVGLHVWIYSKRALKRIVYTRTFSERAVFAGDEIEMIDELANKKMLPLPWLRLESRIHRNLEFRTLGNEQIKRGDLHRTVFSFLPYQRIRRRQKVHCARRGHYQIDAVEMTTGDAFGFMEIYERVSSPVELLVYPKLMSLEEIPLPTHSWLGEIVVRRWIIEDPFLTAGIRDYEFGDPLHAVNWKATARMNQLQVTKKDYTADHYLMIYVNFNQTDDIWLPIIDEDAIEKSLSYAATIAQHAITNGVSTGFGCNSYIGDAKNETFRIEPESGEQQLYHLFETMAKLKVDANKSIHIFLQEDIDAQISGKDILLITSNVTEKMEEKIHELEALGNAVEILQVDMDEQKRHQSMTDKNTMDKEVAS